MKLIEVTKAFATEEQCLAYLEAKRWPDGAAVLFGSYKSKTTSKAALRSHCKARGRGRDASNHDR